MPIFDPKISVAGPSRIARRSVLRGAGALGLAASAGLLGTRVSWGAPTGKKVVFSWSGTGLCLAPVVIARDRGLFEQNQVDVDVISFAGSVDQVLESLATGKADMAVGLTHAWLKPLESGFDVRIVGSAHGGCLRVLATKESGIETIEAVRGKTIGVSSVSGPGRQFFSTYLARRGVDPDKDVEWRAYPGDVLDLAVKKGEIQVISDSNPNLFLIEKRNPGVFKEIANIQTGDYANRLCCIITARADLVRDRKTEVASVVRALIQASEFTADNPNEAARIAANYVPKVPVEDLRAILADLTYRHHPVGTALRDEIEFYARDLKGVGVLKKTTDPAKFAKFLTVDVLS
ncbi:ABC transporter substrate-binding protein [Pigmentiphaga aceris]|uniref:ABC transporter substrate-binding protein n=1 Tax=Pigmentiphaga aceris TaxID=1940612 RepID=A0A5C0B0C8_9BURK|nr:ABC transporter substrate-binding protein [Pigmentiphaga aceris]QEI08058.1 ABC transporter substrate-binding protein [Pigmentiphaga aceris]